MATELQALRASHDRLLAALNDARKFVEDEHDDLIDSFCLRGSGAEMSVSTLDPDKKAIVENVGRLLAKIDDAISRAEEV